MFINLNIYVILNTEKMTLITSGETFVRLTGEDDYALIMIQMTGKVCDQRFFHFSLSYCFISTSFLI